MWNPLHCRWHHIHSITPNHSIYDITCTLGLTSHPLYQTLHPVYLCHHNLSTDITPTFEWHHTHLLCDIICTIYNITPNPPFIPLLYLWHHNLYIWNFIQYVGQHIHYNETSQPPSVSTDPLYRQHHTHSLYDITLAICVASFALHKTSHPQFMNSNHSIMASHPLYLISCPLYLCHHIHCIDIITPTVFLTSYLP